MASFDADRLKLVLLPTCRRVFSEVRQRHQGESFYCMGLFTCGLFSYLAPTAMTEEGLEIVARRYKAEPYYAEESLESLRHSLRWSPCDSPLHLEGEEHFQEVNDVMEEITWTLRQIDFERGWDEFDEFVGRLHTLLVDVLSTVDGEGVFGVGSEREKLFVSMLMGDQDDSILRIGRRLNPPRTIEQFESEWR